MVKHTIALCSVLGSFAVMGQSVVSSQGETYETTTGSISFTVGEVVIDTGTDGTNDLTQGFHQTNWNFLELEDSDVSFEANVYPNPTSDILNIEVGQFDEVQFALIDASGRIIQKGNLTDFITQIDVKQLEPGSYHVQLSDAQNNQLKNFKLLKQN